MLTKKSKTLQSGAVFCALSRGAIFIALAFLVFELFAFFDENKMMCRYAQFEMDYRIPSRAELLNYQQNASKVLFQHGFHSYLLNYNSSFSFLFCTESKRVAKCVKVILFTPSL